MSSTNENKKMHGFTIVEMLIVILVIGILATILFITYRGVQARARDSQNTDTLSKLQKALNLADTQTGSFPTAAQLNSPAWQAQYDLTPSVLKDAKGNPINNIGGTDPSYRINIYLPQGAEPQPCAAIFQVYRDSDQQTVTKIIDNCKAPYGLNDPAPGQVCPSDYSYNGGNIGISSAPITQFCGFNGSSGVS